MILPENLALTIAVQYEKVLPPEGKTEPPAAVDGGAGLGSARTVSLNRKG